ncbi:hypothetical protein XBJ1_1793 [Xenorhabdus bovienii SS-2004]|uniref:Uncharacterized protein n=1 Tax=Xenorhabdus bovienii (strain SS-2004) TaxID=406818 RepID=D3V2F4_XENBS|nr:hypothetical protein XBJ1_1793 [Xenorhabdus bovienii SS-2004]
MIQLLLTRIDTKHNISIKTKITPIELFQNIDIFCIIDSLKSTALSHSNGVKIPQLIDISHPKEYI